MNGRTYPIPNAPRVILPPTAPPAPPPPPPVVASPQMVWTISPAAAAVGNITITIPGVGNWSLGSGIDGMQAAEETEEQRKIKAYDAAMGVIGK